MTNDTPPRTAEQRQRLQQAMDAVAARFGTEAARMLCRMADSDRDAEREARPLSRLLRRRPSG